MVRVIFLDIDGTLRDERFGVPESAVTAIGMCREKGIQVVICTGRNMASIQRDVRILETDGIIAGGGCYILDGHRVQKDACFQYEEIEPILYRLAQKELPFALEDQNRVFMNRAASLWFRQDFERKLEGLGQKERERQRSQNGISYEDTMNEYRRERDRIHKICIWSRGEETPDLISMAQTAGTIVQQGERDGWWYMEALPRGCSKGTAVREWCESRGIRPQDAMSFGDGQNDKDMLLATGIGVAMEDGDEELKACAASVCKTAAKDGIYRELVRRNIIDNGRRRGWGQDPKTAVIQKDQEESR